MRSTCLISLGALVIATLLLVIAPVRDAQALSAAESPVFRYARAAISFSDKKSSSFDKIELPDDSGDDSDADETAEAEKGPVDDIENWVKHLGPNWKRGMELVMKYYQNRPKTNSAQTVSKKIDKSYKAPSSEPSKKSSGKTTKKPSGKLTKGSKKQATDMWFDTSFQVDELPKSNKGAKKNSKKSSKAASKGSRSELEGESRSELEGDSRSELEGDSRSELEGDSRSELEGDSRSELEGDSRSELEGDSRSELEEGSRGAAAAAAAVDDE